MRRGDHQTAMQRLMKDADERMQPGPKGGGAQHHVQTDKNLASIPKHTPAKKASVNPKPR